MEPPLVSWHEWILIAASRRGSRGGDSSQTQNFTLRSPEGVREVRGCLIYIRGNLMLIWSKPLPVLVIVKYKKEGYKSIATGYWWHQVYLLSLYYL